MWKIMIRLDDGRFFLKHSLTGAKYKLLDGRTWFFEDEIEAKTLRDLLESI